MIITQQELAHDIIETTSPKKEPEIILDFISDWEASEQQEMMQQGVDYYNCENDIKDRTRKHYDKDGNLVEDETAPNNRLPHGWHKILVDQKAGYLAGNPINFTDKEAEENEENEEVSPNQEFIERVNSILDEDFNDDLQELVRQSASKGVEWLQVYIDEEGEFNYDVIDAREVVPIWETSRQNKLESLVRYYNVEVDDEERIRVEYWKDDVVIYYVQNDAGQLVYDDIFVDEAEQGHFVVNDQEAVWGRVPFIPFKNNRQMKSDLNYYKELIDSYDKNVSDRDNELEEVQEALMVLKGYQGADAAEAKHNLKHYKLAVVGDDGGIDSVNNEIPVEAKEKHLDRLEEDIVTFGQGVNPKQGDFGNESGVALKHLYTLLDLKCDQTEARFKRAIKKLFWFIAEYLAIKGEGEYNPEAIQSNFDRSMLANEGEKVEMAQKSKGVISDETIASNHPWVDNPQKELDRMNTGTVDQAGQRVRDELEQMANSNAEL